MKRLNKIARRIIALAEEAEQFIQECEDSGNFGESEIGQIRWGFRNGLTMEQVKVFAKPEFKWQQMEEIRKDLEDGMSIDEVKENYNL